MMVSSYLICDVCGQFGPPADFFHENGLRLCYPCWYRERHETSPPADSEVESSADLEPEPNAPDATRSGKG